MTEAKEYTWCFACGKANPIGLKLEFERTDEECSTTFIPQREHQSYDGRMKLWEIIYTLQPVSLPIRQK